MLFLGPVYTLRNKTIHEQSLFGQLKLAVAALYIQHQLARKICIYIYLTELAREFFGILK